MPISLRVTDIGEYIRHRSCDRRFHLRIHHKTETAKLPFYDTLVNSLDPVLEAVGNAREDQWQQELDAAKYENLADGLPQGEHREVTWKDLANKLSNRATRSPAYCRQVKVQGEIGAFTLTGFIDYALVRWHDEQPELLLVECKASRRDRTYHRFQVAIYQILLRQILTADPLTLAGVPLQHDMIRGVVARIDEESNSNQSILALEPLDLASEEADIRQLLSPSGRLAQINERPLAEIGFQFDSKCDGCIYNVHCMAESGRLKAPELLGIDPVTARMLKGAGLTNLDQIANYSVTDSRVEDLQRNPAFTEDLDLLRLRARTRRHTLPGGKATPNEFEVEAIPHTGKGHLPPHEIAGKRLLRVYLAVDYDYTENRIAALSAHVTRSSGRLHTAFVGNGKESKPDPIVYEQTSTKVDIYGKPDWKNGVQITPLPLNGELVEYKTAPWTGTNYADDSAAERELIQRFFKKLVNLIAKHVGTDAVPIHFYVWTEMEIHQLVEGCTRAGSTLLGNLQQLLGCRDGLEQLLYSSVQSEVVRRFALGWTGRALPVVAALRWFGRNYHWDRIVNGKQVALDSEFSQNIFDFVYQLPIDPVGHWSTDPDAIRHRFEVMCRFGDSLPAAYWHAIWGTLPDRSTSKDNRLKQALERYAATNIPNMLEEFLIARVHALRWIEESIQPKNDEIDKKPLAVTELPDFHLERDDVAKAAVDFLRLDHHVKFTKWLSEHLLTPYIRVPLGRTLPLYAARVEADKKTITARIRLQDFNNLALADLEPRCSFAVGSFVRISPWNGDPKQGQTLRQLSSVIGYTGIITVLDWKTGAIQIEGMFIKENRYQLPSGGFGKPQALYEKGYATLDENITDFVAGRVEKQLQESSHVYKWLDPIQPAPPAVDEQIPAKTITQLKSALERFPLPPQHNFPASEDQIAAILDGLNTRLQLLQGPPGTGKTTTTALAVLLRVLTNHRPGDIVLMTAHTHTALDTLLARISRYQRELETCLAAHAFKLPQLLLAKVNSSEPTDRPAPTGIAQFTVEQLGTKKQMTEATTGQVLVLGGTTGALLKLHNKLIDLKSYNGQRGLTAKLLIVDEASMLVFPHFLATATLLERDGRMMLTGDHRQLAPITAHDWENEDRPPTVLYQPFSSAYDAVRRIIDPDESGRPRIPATAGVRSALRLTFRLPPIVRELIAKLYRMDDIELIGLPRPQTQHAIATPSPWNPIWETGHGLYLAVHEEDSSKRSNETEYEIVRSILSANTDLPPGSTAIITPHRAQRSLFQAKLTEFYREGDPTSQVDVIDTVERLQGGERPNVIVSATVSDPTAIDANVEFILDLNRANVAFSRVQDRLVVVCAATLLNHIPPETEDYTAAMLWKSLREICTQEVGRTKINGHTVRLLRPADTFIYNSADDAGHVD